MTKLIGITLLLISIAGFASAAAAPAPAPEIDPTSAVGAFTLLSGMLLIIRNRQRK